MSQFTYHPKSAITLGEAYDDRNPSNDVAANKLFAWEDKSEENPPISAAIEFEMSEIHSKKELYERLSLDISAEAKFGLTKAEASLNWEQQVTYTETSLVFFFSAKKTYYDEKINGRLVLSDAGKKQLETLCNSNKINRFLEGSGTDVVTRVTKATIVGVIYSFTIKDKTKIDDLRSHLGIKWSTGDANVDFEKYKRETDSSLNVFKKAFQNNVNELTPKDARISEIIGTDPGNLIEIKKALKNIIDNISEADRKTAPIISFITLPINKITDIINSDCFEIIDSYMDANQRINEECVNLREYMLDVDYRLLTATKYRKKFNERQFLEKSDKLLDEAIKDYKKIKSEISKTYSKTINCKAIEEIEIFDSDIPEIEFQKILKPPYLSLKNWEIQSIDAGCGNERLTVKSKIFLSLNIDFPESISEIELIQNNTVIRSFFQSDIQSIVSNNGSTVGIWSNDYSDIVYCFGCIADHRNSQFQTVSQQHKNSEKDKFYILRINTVNNAMHEIKIGNIVNPIG
jgi:hypothetical protein